MTTNSPISLTAGEAAEVLGLAPSTLAKLRLSGNGPVYCKLGRRVVYRREGLAAWLESRVPSLRHRTNTIAAGLSHRRGQTSIGPAGVNHLTNHFARACLRCMLAAGAHARVGV